MEVSKNHKETQKIGKNLFKKQGGIDPITGLEITNLVIDHDHVSGHIRGALQRESNSFEGTVIRSYNRYIRHLGVPLDVVLNGVIDYNNKDYSQNPIHHTEVTKRVNRLIQNLTAQQQKDIISQYKKDVDVKNIKVRKKHIRELLKQGKLWDIQWD